MQNASVCGTADERVPTFAEWPTNVCKRLQNGQQSADVCRTANKRLPTFAEPPTNLECQRLQNGSASNVCSLAFLGVCVRLPNRHNRCAVSSEVHKKTRELLRTNVLVAVLVANVPRAQ